MTDDLADELAEEAARGMMDAIAPVLPTLYREFCRLNGYSLPTTPVAQAIDDATGYSEQRYREFAKFVREMVFERFPG